MTVYGDGLPAGSFARVSSEFTIPCPELLFLELASVMDPAALELVGYELCGTFSRDHANPRTGGVVHGLRPLTSVQKIKDYLSRCTGIRGLSAARRAVERVRDDAWSAMEAIVALLLVRPQDEGGYGIGELVLNEREGAPGELRQRGVRESRVPDIGLINLPVGFNYDGHGHLDLGSIPVETQSAAEIRARLAEVREKYVDDLRRNRELLAGGRIVMPVVAEDLMEYGGLDTVVLEAVLATERLTGCSGEEGVRVRRALDKQLSAKRQQLIWSLYPWTGGHSLGNY